MAKIVIFLLQILFLNKVDIFRTKIMTSSVKQYFPDYDGDDQDFNAARTYFKNRFVRLNRSPSKEIYPSFTNATDTSLLKIVMASVTDIIITNSLRDSKSTLIYSSHLEGEGD